MPGMCGSTSPAGTVSCPLLLRARASAGATWPGGILRIGGARLRKSDAPPGAGLRLRKDGDGLTLRVVGGVVGG